MWALAGCARVGWQKPSTVTRGRERDTRPRVDLERFEVASARRRRLQRAVRRAVDAPSDGDGLLVQEGVPVAVAHGRVRNLLKPDARGVAARMDPPPVRP